MSNRLANEVISSTIRILSAAGFDEDQIRQLLTEASTRVSSIFEGSEEDAPLGDVALEFTIGSSDDAENMSWEFMQKFEEIPEFKQLSRIERRSQALDHISGTKGIEEAIDLIEKALPFTQSAQNWLLTEAPQAGISVYPSRDQWARDASDEELDNEGKNVFLDDYGLGYHFVFNLISSAAEASSRSMDSKHFARIIELLESEEILYPDDLTERLSRAGSALQKSIVFRDYISNLSGYGELMQSAMIDDFIRSTRFEGGAYIVEGWVDALAEEGVLTKEKRSGRWRINVH